MLPVSESVRFPLRCPLCNCSSGMPYVATTMLENGAVCVGMRCGECVHRGRSRCPYRRPHADCKTRSAESPGGLAFFCRVCAVTAMSSRGTGGVSKFLRPFPLPVFECDGPGSNRHGQRGQTPIAREQLLVVAMIGLLQEAAAHRADRHEGLRFCRMIALRFHRVT